MSSINKIWLLMGQSHMSGVSGTIGNLPTNYKSKYLHNARAWDGSKFVVLNSDLDNSSIPTAPSTRGNLSYAMTDVGNYLNEDVYLMNFSIGGTYLAEVAGQDDFSFDSVGEYYDNIVTEINAIKSWMAARDKAYIFEGIIWWQGQADATSSTYATFYGANLTAFYDGLVTETGNANLKLYQDYIQNAPATNYVHYVGLNNTKTTFTAADSTNRKVYYPNFQTWNADNVHPSVTAMYLDWNNNILPFIKADL